MPYSNIAIIGAPLDLGQGRRGVDMGPSALRVAGLDARVASLGYLVEDLGNVPVERPRLGLKATSGPSTSSDRRACMRLLCAWTMRSRAAVSPWCWEATTPWRSAPSAARRAIFAPPTNASD